MKRHLSMRLAVCAALVGSASLAAVVVPSGVASAAALTVSCKTSSGSASTIDGNDSVKLASCSGSGSGATGPSGSGTQITNHKQPSGSGTETITWKSKEKTAVSFKYTETESATTVKADCKAVSGDTAVAVVTSTGSVVAKGTTTTKLIGSKTSGKSCVYLTKSHGIYEVGIAPDVF
jgi:hypothetical protein